MKTIDNVWHICRDGWIFELATKKEIVEHVFDGMSLESFEDCFVSA